MCYLPSKFVLISKIPSIVNFNINWTKPEIIILRSDLKWNVNFQVSDGKKAVFRLFLRPR